MLSLEKTNMEGSLVFLVFYVPFLTILMLLMYNFDQILSMLGSKIRNLTVHATSCFSGETESGLDTTQSTDADVTTPLSVNFHLTRQCNYRCGFCFHTSKTSFVLPLGEAMRGLSLLTSAGEFPWHVDLSQCGLKILFQIS